MMWLDKYRTISSIFCLAIAVTLVFYVNLQVVLYADDLFYGTFFRDGFLGFIRQNIWHYNNFNGRVFVHLLAQVTLVLDTSLFPYVNLGFLILISLFTCKFQDSSDEKILYTAFFLSTIMLLDVSILRESYLWISASFNYTLGIVMIAFLLLVYKQYLQTRKLKCYMVLLAFLSGATTEQIGMTAIFAIFVLSLTRVKDDETTIKELLTLIIPCIAGLVTIFLSGATLRRLGNENLTVASGALNFEIIELIINFARRFNNIALVMHEARFGVIFAIFGILVGLLPCFRTSISPRLKIGFAYSAIILFLQFTQFIPLPAFFLATSSTIFFIATALLFLKDKDFRFTAILILSAFFSLFIMLFTNSHDPRIAFPAILLIIAACANLITICKVKQTVTLPIYVVACAVVFLPVISGFVDNRQIMNEIIENVNFANKNGGDIFYNIDFRDSHRHLMAHDDGFFYQQFRTYYRIASYTTIYFVSDERAPIYTKDGVRIRMPILYIDDEPLMPFSLVITALGGVFDWTPTYSYIRFNNIDFTLNNRTNVIRVLKNGEYHYFDLSDRAVRSLHSYWYATDIANIFGIIFEYSDGKYIVASLPKRYGGYANA